MNGGREDFQERFRLQKEMIAPTQVELTNEEKETRRNIVRSRVFWSFILFLFVCPFGITGILFYTLARYEDLAGPGMLELLGTLSEDEKQALSRDTGLTDLEFVTGLYDSRFLIATLIFTFFFGTIAVLVILRGALKYFLGKR